MTLLLAAAAVLTSGVPAPDALPSWNDTASRQALVAFVESVTKEGAPTFVPPAERIAVFDNDGTLWAEQPMYFQLAFALDRIHALAPEHPEWKETEPFASVLKGELEGVMAGGEKAVAQLVMTTHAGMTADEFGAVVDGWIRTAKHPQTGRLYSEMVYQPMLEVLDYLRANGFKTFIVSGGGQDFMRVFAERVYGIPPEQVMGSAIEASYEMRDGKPVIVKQPELDFVDDKAGKPVGIYRLIGRRPILAFGNSDGDREMLQYTAIGSPRPSLAVLVHHTDGEREVAYDRESHIGKLDAALDEAAQRGWVVVDMKADWKRVFPWQ